MMTRYNATYIIRGSLKQYNMVVTAKNYFDVLDQLCIILHSIDETMRVDLVDAEEIV